MKIAPRRHPTDGLRLWVCALCVVWLWLEEQSVCSVRSRPACSAYGSDGIGSAETLVLFSKCVFGVCMVEGGCMRRGSLGLDAQGQMAVMASVFGS